MAFQKFKTPGGNVYFIQVIPFASDTKHKVILLDESMKTIIGILCEENQVEKVVVDYHKKALDYFKLDVKFNDILNKSK